MSNNHYAAVMQLSVYSCSELAEELENGLGLLICLSQHGLCSLLKNVELGVVQHLGSHVCIADTGLSFCQVLGSCCEVLNLVLKTVLCSTECSTYHGNLVDSVVNLIDCSVSSLLCVEGEVLCAKTISSGGDVHVSLEVAHTLCLVGECEVNGVLCSSACLKYQVVCVGQRSCCSIVGVSLRNAGCIYRSNHFRIIRSCNRCSGYIRKISYIVSINIDFEINSTVSSLSSSNSYFITICNSASYAQSIICKLNIVASAILPCFISINIC